MTRYMLDTNIIGALVKNNPGVTQKIIAALPKSAILSAFTENHFTLRVVLPPFIQIHLPRMADVLPRMVIRFPRMFHHFTRMENHFARMGIHFALTENHFPPMENHFPPMENRFTLMENHFPSVP